LDFATFGAAKKEGKYPSGLPVLKIDGTEYLQSAAILSYAGKIAQVAGGDGAKLYPVDAIKALAIDEALDIIVQDTTSKCPQHPDDDTKKKLREEYAEGKCKAYCQQLSNLVEKSGGPFFDWSRHDDCRGTCNVFFSCVMQLLADFGIYSQLG
jgi:hypothetical protein